MNKLFLILILISAHSFATLNCLHYRGCATTNDSSNFNNVTNYLEAPVGILTSDSIVLDSLNRGTVKSCSLTAAVQCSILNIASAFTGATKQPVGKKLTVGRTKLLGGGALTLLDTVSIVRVGGGLFNVNPTGTYTSTTLKIFLNNTGDSVVVGKAGYFYNLDIVGNGKKIIWANTSTSGITNTMTTGSSDTLEAYYSFTANPDASLNPFSGIGSDFIFNVPLGSTAQNIAIYTAATAARTYTIPKLSFINAAKFVIGRFTGTNNVIFSQTGDLYSDSNMTIYNHIAAGSMTYSNTGNKNIHCHGVFTIGNDVAGTVTYNMGAGRNLFQSLASLNSGTCVINWQTSADTILGNYAPGTNTTCDSGISLFVFNGNSTITPTSTKRFYDIQVTAGAIVQADSIRCNSINTSGNGSWNATGKWINCKSDFVLNGSGANIFPTYLNLNGACNFTINGIGTQYPEPCSLTTLNNVTVSLGQYYNRTFGKWDIVSGKTITYTPKDSITISVLDSSNINGATWTTSKASKSWRLTWAGRESTATGEKYDGASSTSISQYGAWVDSGYHWDWTTDSYNHTHKAGTKYVFMEGGQSDASRDSSGVAIEKLREGFLQTCSGVGFDTSTHIILIGFAHVTAPYDGYNQYMRAADSIAKLKVDSLKTAYASKFHYHFWGDADSIFLVDLSDNLHPNNHGWDMWGAALQDSMDALGIKNGDIAQRVGQSYTVPSASYTMGNMLQRCGNHVYVSIPANTVVKNMDIAHVYNFGPVIDATDPTNLSRGGNYNITFSYDLDSTCLSLDTLVIDSISGTYDTIFNWKTIAPAIDTIVDAEADSIQITISACNGDTTARDTFFVHTNQSAIINKNSFKIGIGIGF